MAEVLVIQPEHTNYLEQDKQRYYDLETQFAELVDGSMRTDFELVFTGNDLIGEDGRSISEVADIAIEDAKKLAREDPALSFEIRRRYLEKDEIRDLVEMAKGTKPNTKIVISDFPPELMDASQDAGGYNVTRKQTMLRVLIRKPDGNVHMYSQSLDGSNRSALEAIYARFGLKPEAGELLGQNIDVDIPWAEQPTLVDELTGVHDRELTALLGGEWYAGRQPADYENTYDFVRKQKDIVEECVRLDRLGWLNADVMYKMAATMQQRFIRSKTAPIEITPPYSGSNEAMTQALYNELEIAGAQAKQLGKTFSACGVTLDALGLSVSIEDQLKQAGYGNKSNEDKFGPLTFKCQKGHPNTRPHGKLIDNCKTCGISVKC